MWSRLPLGALTLSAVALTSSGCLNKMVDSVVLKRVIPSGQQISDTRQACAMGTSLSFAVGGITKKTPEMSLSLSEATAGVCTEKLSWEAEIDQLIAGRMVAGPAKAERLTDAAIRARRYHAASAAQFERAWTALDRQMGPLGDSECPKIKEHEEIVYVVGMVAGALALIHDRKAEGANNIPLDRLGKVGRAAKCLDTEKFWHLGPALEAAAWATIPGSGPEGVDPWQVLAEAADKGDSSGVRVARSLQAKIASNAGNDQLVGEALDKYAASMKNTPRNQDWALLDQYSYDIALHEADKLWVKETGHRAEVLSSVPVEPVLEPLGDDPFATDPFAAPTPNESEETTETSDDSDAKETP